MDPIDGVSGTSRVAGVEAAAPVPPARPTGSRAAMASPAPQVAAVRPGFAEDRAAGPMPPSPIGGDGRFEKIILAVQALRLDDEPGAARTRRTEQMRAAAEQIFQIDGLPQLFPPSAPSAGPRQAAAAAAAPADSAAGRSEEAPALPAPAAPAGEPSG
jgi:hypothetical protein